MQTQFWRQRGFLVTAGFLVAVLALSGAVLAFIGGGSPAVPTAARTAGSVPARASGEACSVPAGDQRVPLQPPQAHWDRVGDYWVPGSTVVGPGRVDGHARHCWAHSPTGAAFALYGYFAAQMTWPTDVAMLRELTAPSQARDEALQRGGSPPSDPSKRVELVGFRVLDYSAAAATVMLAARVAPAPTAEMDLGQTVSQLGEVPVRLLWLDGDWKVVAEPEGFKAEPIESIVGFVPWSAP